MSQEKINGKKLGKDGIPASMSAPRYSGLATFMRTPFVQDPTGLDIALIGVPYEVGGITTVEAQTLLRGMRGLDLIGADVVEVAPPFDPTGNTALVAATIMFEILCLLAESISLRKKKL